MDRKNIKKFSSNLFSDKLWTLDESGFSKTRRRFIKFVKLIRITLDTFADNRMGFQCVALSYFCTLALIPAAAIIFGVSDGLGLADKVTELAYKYIPTDPNLINLITEKASNIIASAQSGVVGFFSALLFMWSILWLMFQTERVFNNVWGIRKVPRKIYKRFSVYLVMIVLIPFIILIFSTGIIAYTNLLGTIGVHFKDWKVIEAILGWILFYGVTTFTLALMYTYIPAAEVKFRHSLTSAAVSGLVFVVFQYLYLETQMFVYRLNAVYGAIAIVPLFLIWLNISWQIVIYGAEFTYSLQNVDKYNIPDDLRLRDIKSERHRIIDSDEFEL